VGGPKIVAKVEPLRATRGSSLLKSADRPPFYHFTSRTPPGEPRAAGFGGEVRCDHLRTPRPQEDAPERDICALLVHFTRPSVGEANGNTKEQKTHGEGGRDSKRQSPRFYGFKHRYALASLQQRAVSAHLRPLLATLALCGGRRPLAKEGSHRLLRPECARLGLTVERARRQRTRRDRRVIEPGWSKMVESATFERGRARRARAPRLAGRPMARLLLLGVLRRPEPPSTP
jgi:hypothetical protein